MDDFEYDAPQLFEPLQERASRTETDNADIFFSKTTELNERTQDIENVLTPKHKNNLNEQYFTPMNNSSSHENVPSQVLANITNLNAKMACKTNRAIKKAKRRSWGLANVQRENVTETLRQDIAKLTTETKYNATKRKGSPLKGAGVKFMIYDTVDQFQTNSPTRLSSKRHKKVETKMTSTICVSPKLLTKMRCRGSTYPTIEERIIQELEEQKSSQVKARTLNRKIFDPPDNSNKPAPKPPTVPEPFKLTLTLKKEAPKEECFTFRARPVPESLNVSQVSISPFKGLKRTKPEPFSFAERNNQKQLEMKEKIKKIIEEETKIPKFQAQPVPHYISQNCTSCNSSNISTISRKQSDNNSVEDFGKSFKAKPAIVLLKEPFVPKKAEAPLTETIEICLNTERRAAERQRFESSLQEKEERLKEEIKRIEIMREKQNKEALAKLRKELIHKAKPVPKYPEVHLGKHKNTK